MAKRFDNKKNDKKLEKLMMRNWIILGVTAALIIALVIMSKTSA